MKLCIKYATCGNFFFANDVITFILLMYIEEEIFRKICKKKKKNYTMLKLKKKDSNIIFYVKLS
jgi:hypothetical protein